MDRSRIGSNRSRFGTLITAAMAAVLVTGCAQIGSGDRLTEERPISDATRIAVSSGIALTVRIGEPASATVTAQENILPLIRIEVVDGTLTIEPSEAIMASDRTEVAVTVSDLEELTASGGCTVELIDVALVQLTADLSGGSRLTGGKSVSSLILTASGGSRADLDGLTAAGVQIDASGGSVANLRATDTVTGSASGGARVTVKGGATVAVNASGGASVESE
jgi:hypothetical protein